MKHWMMQVFLPFLGSMYLVGGSNGVAVMTRVLQDRVSFNVTYNYRIDLNASDATPSIDAAIELLQNETLDALEDLVKDQDDPPLQFVNFESSRQGDCDSESTLCSFVESTVTLSLRASTNQLIVEFATLEEVQSFLESFNRNNEDVFVSFLGPFIVRAYVSVRLDGVTRRMSEDDIAVFEETFWSTVGPPLLLKDPPIVLRTVAVFLQQFAPERRKLQADDSYNVVRVHVTGRCNGCSDAQFERLIDDVIDVDRRNFGRNLEENGQEAGTDYFDDAVVSVAMEATAPGISESSLDFFSPPDPFPTWVAIVLGVSVSLMVIGIFCVACRSNRVKTGPSKEQLQARNQPAARTSKADEENITGGQESARTPATYQTEEEDDKNQSMESHYTYQTIDRALTEEE